MSDTLALVLVIFGVCYLVALSLALICRAR